MKNPFTPTFGKVPPVMAGRAGVLETMRGAFENGSGDPNLSTMLVGARGTGKTVLMKQIRECAAECGWVSAGTTAAVGMLDDILERADETAGAYIAERANARLTGLNVGGVLGLTWEFHDTAQGNWRTRMNRLFDQFERYDIGLLITVDEVRANVDELVRLVATYQHFVNEDRQVALVMAGLPHNVSALLANEEISFLRRSQRQHLGRISDVDIDRALRKTVEGAGKTISREALDTCVHATEGFAFMMQLVGYCTWLESGDFPQIEMHHAREGVRTARRMLREQVLETTYRDLSANDRRFLEAMLADAVESHLGDVAKRMGVTNAYAATYRARLLEQGAIRETGRGVVAFELPGLREYVAERSGVSPVA